MYYNVFQFVGEFSAYLRVDGHGGLTLDNGCTVTPCKVMIY